MKSLKKIGAALLLLSATLGQASDSGDFDQIWNAVVEKSHGVSSARYEAQASDLGASRESRHWAPRLLLNAQVVSSNDPGTTLFSTLNSRSLLMSDLNPSTLNEPAREWYRRGALTLDWALFEGGSSSAKAKGAKLESVSRSLTLQAKMKEEYASLARDYAKLITLQEQLEAYQTLKTKLEGFLSRYKVGSRDNPVGYSGLLGMRSLLNRLEGYLDQVSVEIASIKKSMQIKSDLNEINVPKNKAVTSVAFIDSKLETQSRSGGSYQVEAIQMGAEALAEYSNAERARWLPKVGLFASENLTSGPRDTGTSTEYGAYLQWELFNARNFGVSKEASLRASAAQERASEALVNSQIANEALDKTIPVLRQNMKRIHESSELSSEQVDVTEKLFRNGSINALQFVEVLSRRTDVVQSKKDVEMAYFDSLVAHYLQNASQK